MSNPEQTPSIAFDAHAIAEALGSKAPVYIGELTITDLITGATTAKLEAAKRARELALTAPDQAIPGRIGKLAKIIDTPTDDIHEPELTTGQKDLVAKSIQWLVAIYDRTQEGQDPETTIRELYAVFFDRDPDLEFSAPGRILATVPEEYAQEVGFDPEQLRAIQKELSDADYLARTGRERFN